MPDEFTREIPSPAAAMMMQAAIDSGVNFGGPVTSNVAINAFQDSKYSKILRSVLDEMYFGQYDFGAEVVGTRVFNGLYVVWRYQADGVMRDWLSSCQYATVGKDGTTQLLTYNTEAPKPIIRVLKNAEKYASSS